MTLSDDLNLAAIEAAKLEAELLAAQDANAQLVAQNAALQKALERIAAERNDHLMFTGTHASDMYATAREALERRPDDPV